MTRLVHDRVGSYYYLLGVVRVSLLVVGYFQ